MNDGKTAAGFRGGNAPEFLSTFSTGMLEKIPQLDITLEQISDDDDALDFVGPVVGRTASITSSNP
jgi:hypothetical protein